MDDPVDMLRIVIPLEEGADQKGTGLLSAFVHTIRAARWLFVSRHRIPSHRMASHPMMLVCLLANILHRPAHSPILQAGRAPTRSQTQR